MSTQDDGGPAFPVIEGQELNQANPRFGEMFGTKGMTLRDYFAIHAPSGELWRFQYVYEGPEHLQRELSREAQRYAFADALLAAGKGGAK